MGSIAIFIFMVILLKLSKSLTTKLDLVCTVTHMQSPQDTTAHCWLNPVPLSATQDRPRLAWNDVAVFVGENDFHAPIQLTIGGRVITGNRVLLAITPCPDTVAANSRVDQSRPHSIGTPVREILIEVVTAPAVGVAFNQHFIFRVLLEKICQLVARCADHPIPTVPCWYGTKRRLV